MKLSNIYFGNLARATCDFVFDFINQNQWNLTKLNFVLPANIISEVKHINFDLHNVDYHILLLDHSGLFSSKFMDPQNAIVVQREPMKL
ncbi:hypothetical protein H5410_021790 [Solanum commersonii]|uniref:Uncharacterized protein n=1 Tax=Solanum commersonii TaxID=4109 RepID=A0A9J5ZDI7_SOLCO|nr:hypothetical protein H5410_021790 [Solanum commersonii]